MKTTYVTRRSEVEVYEINTAYVAENRRHLYTYTVKCVPLLFTCASRLAPATAAAALTHAPPPPPEWPPSMGAYLNSVAFSPSRSQVYIRGGVEFTRLS